MKLTFEINSVIFTKETMFENILVYVNGIKSIKKLLRKFRNRNKELL